MEYDWKSWRSLSPDLKKEFCSFSNCSHCNEKERKDKCSLWTDDIRYKFLTKIIKKLDDDHKLQFCELTECSYKTSGLEGESPCEFYSGKKRKTETQYCSKWFSLKDLSILDPISIVIVKKVDIDNMDTLIKDIANRWNVEISI